MSLTITFDLVHESSDAYFFMTDPGAYRLASGAILAGLTKTTSGNVVEWYRSTDNGASFAHVSDTAANPNVQHQRLLHFADNSCVFAYADWNTTDVWIIRSTNEGSSWTQVANWHKARPPSTSMTANAALTYNNGAGYFAGRFDTTSAGGTRQNAVRSTDNGQTWSREAGLLAADGSTWPTALGVSPNGVWLGGAEYPNLYKTTDAGANWTTLSNLTTPSGFAFIQITDIIWMTNTTAITCAFGTATGNRLFPYVYKTTNSGTSWTSIPSSDFASWPTTGIGYQCHVLDRVTRDLCGLGLMLGGTQTIIPWRYSTDAGSTWPIIPTATAIDPADNNGAPGAMTTTLDGHIIATCTTRTTGANLSRIFRGTVTC